MKMNLRKNSIRAAMVYATLSHVFHSIPVVVIRIAGRLGS
jgi:hypothetical protein